MRQALQAQQKRMQTSGGVAHDADVAAEDAGSGGTQIDMDQLTRGALCNLLAQFAAEDVGSSSATPVSVRACADA